MKTKNKTTRTQNISNKNSNEKKYKVAGDTENIKKELKKINKRLDEHEAHFRYFNNNLIEINTTVQKQLCNSVVYYDCYGKFLWRIDNPLVVPVKGLVVDVKLSNVYDTNPSLAFDLNEAGFNQYEYVRFAVSDVIYYVDTTAVAYAREIFEVTLELVIKKKVLVEKLHSAIE